MTFSLTFCAVLLFFLLLSVALYDGDSIWLGYANAVIAVSVLLVVCALTILLVLDVITLVTRVTPP